MADTYISVQQASPAPGEVAIYTCPAATSFVMSSLVVTNTTASAVTVRVRIGIGGAGAATKQYLLYDTPLAAKTLMALTLGLTMTATDVMYVDASASGVAFQLGGVQII